MELSQEKKTQIAACHGKGMTLSEISARCGLVEGVVAEFLESIGKTPNKSERRKYRRVTDEQKAQMQKLADEGRSVYTIAKEMNIDIKTVQRYLKNANKEKEPATAATVTDSMDAKTGVCDTVSISKDNTIEPKSQEQTDKLQGVDVFAVLENTLNDWLGIVGMGMIDPQATIVELSASVDDAAVTFEYKGERYFLAFGRR